MNPNKTASHLLGAVLPVALVLASATAPVQAQFGPLVSAAHAPQAKSQQELDDYLEIIADVDPQKTIQNVERFASQYPQSELLGIAYQYQMHAYERVGNLQGVLEAGEKALALQRDNINTLLTLASAIPKRIGTGADAAVLLQRAGDSARQALREIARLHIPREIPLERWKVLRGELEAQAHEALGMVAVKRNQPQVAISEFETAAWNNPTPQGSQFYRLGLVYAMTGQRERAEGALRRAAELGPDALRELAQSELKKLTAPPPGANQP